MMQRILVVGVLAAWSALGLAQNAAAPAGNDAKITELKAQLESMQKEIDALKAGTPKAEKAKEAEKEKTIIPKWVENFTNFSVDLRYRGRYENDENLTHDRDRWRNDLRARIAINGKVNDNLDLVARLGFYKTLGEGPMTSPVDRGTKPWTYNGSTNNIWADLVYIDYHPGTLDKLPFLGVGAEWLEGVSPFFRANEYTGIHVLAGKFEDPYYHPGNSTLLFDAQGFEGVATTFKKNIGGAIDAFGTGGGYWLRERSAAGDSGLFAAQFGGIYKFVDDEQVAMNMTGALGYYYFSHIDGRTSLTGATSGFSGNTYAGTVYTNDYNLLTAAAECNLTIKKVPFFETLPLLAFLEYSTNTATGGGTDGYLIGAGIGKSKKFGDLRLYYNWRELQADCQIGGFPEGPFGQSTNTRGHSVSVDMTLMKGLVFGVKGYAGERTVSAATGDRDYNEAQVYVIAKF